MQAINDFFFTAEHIFRIFLPIERDLLSALREKLRVFFQHFPGNDPGVFYLPGTMQVITGIEKIFPGVEAPVGGSYKKCPVAGKSFFYAVLNFRRYFCIIKSCRQAADHGYVGTEPDFS